MDVVGRGMSLVEADRAVVTGKVAAKRLLQREAATWIRAQGTPLGIGIDAPMWWSAGPGGSWSVSLASIPGLGSLPFG